MTYRRTGQRTLIFRRLGGPPQPPLKVWTKMAGSEQRLAFGSCASRALRPIRWRLTRHGLEQDRRGLVAVQRDGSCPSTHQPGDDTPVATRLGHLSLRKRRPAAGGQQSVFVALAIPRTSLQQDDDVIPAK